MPARRKVLLYSGLSAVCILLAATLGIVIYELRIKGLYTSSVQAIEEKLNEARATGKPLSGRPADALIQGNPRRTPGIDAGKRHVDFLWSSLFRTYSMRMLLGPEGHYVGMETMRVADATQPGKGSGTAAGILRGKPGLSADAAPAVMLTRTASRDPRARSDVGLLVRELARQAVLVSAREEFGVLTRDEVLGESMGRGEEPVLMPLSVSVFQGADGKLVVAISNAGRTPGPLTEYTLTIGGQASLEALATQLEAMSRKEFVAGLTKAGYKPAGARPASQAVVPASIARNLDRWSSLAQFSTVRALHDEIRKSGESPELLAALARGYANLGSLTELNWSPAHKGFKARALLYAERLLARHPGPPGHRARAYVRTLIGLQSAALDDLKLAGAARPAAGKPGDVTAPPWVGVIDAYCNGNVAGLNSTPAGLQPLARYLQLLEAEASSNPFDRISAAERLLEVAPDCYRARLAALRHDVREDRMTVVNRTIAVHRRGKLQDLVEINAAFAKAAYAEILEIPGLPEEVRALATTVPADVKAEGKNRTELIQALRESGRLDRDVQEPSLELAAQLIHEAGFVMAWKMMDLEHRTGPRPAFEIAGPLGAGHAYAPFLELHRFDEMINIRRLGELEKVGTHDIGPMQKEPLSEVQKLNDLELDGPVAASLLQFLHVFYCRHPVGIDNLLARSLEHDDLLLGDLLDRARRSPDLSAQAQAARRARQICPNSAAAWAAAVNLDWEYAAPLAMKWETARPECMALHRSLSNRYLALNKVEDAARCLKRQIALWPQRQLYNTLAELYQSHGDQANWAVSLEASLPVLEDPQQKMAILYRLIGYFRGQNDLQAASRNADAAAELGESWAIRLAAECREGLGDWEGAERVLRQVAERNSKAAPNSAVLDPNTAEWYFWCRRMGRGDVDAARALIEPAMASSAASSKAEGRTLAATYSYLEGNAEQALTHYRWLFDFNQDPYFGLQAALIADELGNVELRDQLLRDSLRSGVRFIAPVADLIHDFRNSLAEAAPIPLDLKMMESRIERQGPGEPTAEWYYLGRFLLLRGRTEEGLGYLKRAAGSPQNGKQTSTLAGAALVQRDLRPEAHRAVELLGDLAPVTGSVQQAWTDLRNEDATAAFASLAPAIKQAPGSASLLYLRALAYKGLKDFALAEADCTRCLEQFPDSADLLCLRGVCRQSMQNFTGAIEDFEHAAKADPRYGTSQNNLATLYATCNDPQYRDGQRAMKWAREALESDRLLPWIQHLTLAAAAAEAGDFDEAVKQSLEALKLSPPNLRESLQSTVDRYRQGKTFR